MKCTIEVSLIHRGKLNPKIPLLIFFALSAILTILFLMPLSAISQDDNPASDCKRFLSGNIESSQETEGIEKKEITAKAPPSPSQDAQLTNSRASAPDEVKGSAILSSIRVKDFNIIGNTVLKPETLAKLTAPYKGREITFEELQSLRAEISRNYVDRGYINSGAIIPDQQIKDGVITLHIVEGVLKEIQVHGNIHFQPEYIERRLRVAAGSPLNIHDLQTALKLLQQERCIKRVNAELKPGMKLGESILDLQIEEESPYRIQFEASNNNSSSVGDLQGKLRLVDRNLLGKGDTLAGTVGVAEGLNDVEISYDTPITARGTSLRLRFSKSNSTVIEDIFKDLDIKSNSESYSVTIDHTYTSSLKKTSTCGITTEVRKSESFLLGEPFSFSPGAEDGRINETVIRLFHELITRSQAHVFALRSTFNIGIDALDSTINNSGEDSRFFYFLGNAQWIQRLKFLDAQLTFRSDFQYTGDPVPPLEKFAVGGMNTVRGYQENQFVRDNAFVASLEHSFPVITYHQRNGVVQLASFVDFGESWNKRNKSAADNSAADNSITGAGFGLKWQIIKDVNLLIYKGFPLTDIKAGDKDNLQEKGVYFRFTAFLF